VEATHLFQVAALQQSPQRAAVVVVLFILKTLVEMVVQGAAVVEAELMVKEPLTKVSTETARLVVVLVALV
jgi:hypothetical protein